MSLPVEIYIKILGYAVDNISLKTYNMVYDCVGAIINDNSLLRDNINELTKALEADDIEKAQKILVKYPEYKDIFDNRDNNYYKKIVTECDNIDFIMVILDILKKRYYNNHYHNNIDNLINIIFDKIKNYDKELFTKLYNI